MKTMKIQEAIPYVMEKHKIPDQYEVAKTFGISQGTVSNYMKGKVTLPNPEVAGILYGQYDIVVYPFVEEFVKDEWERILRMKGK